MGFGMLLIGYFIANMMALNVLGGIFRVGGYLLVLFAAKKLSQYDRSFISLMICSIAMIAVSGVGAFSDISAFLYKYALISSPIIAQSVVDIFTAIRMFLDLVFTALLCYSVKSIAKDTGATKIVFSAVRNFIFFCVYFVLQLLVWIAHLSGNTAFIGFVTSAAIPVWMILINILCMILICWMLFSCYSGICDSNSVGQGLDSSDLEIKK